MTTNSTPCAVCNGTGMVGIPGAPCPFCKLTTPPAAAEPLSERTEREQLAAEVKRLAYLMSAQDVSAATCDGGPSRYAFDKAKQTSREFEAAVAALQTARVPLSDEQINTLIYDALSEIAGIDTSDVSLRDNSEAWEVMGRLRAALATQAPAPEPADEWDCNAWFLRLMALVDEHGRASTYAQQRTRAAVYEHASLTGPHWKAAKALREAPAQPAAQPCQGDDCDELAALKESFGQLLAENVRLKAAAEQPDAAAPEVPPTGKDCLTVQPSLACGHPATLMLCSVETGEPLYCELCDDKSARRDAEQMEQELTVKLAGAEETIRQLKSALHSAAAPEVPADTRDATGRTPTDYALEFAERMAKDAEQFIEAVNRYGTAMTEITEDEEVERAEEGMVEFGRSLRRGIYEFRKAASEHPQGDSNA